MSTQIQSYLAATAVKILPMASEGSAFSPGSDYSLLLTGKRFESDEDDAALFQLAIGIGLEVDGSNVIATLAAAATENLTPQNLYVGIRATHLTTGETFIVAEVRWQLKRPTTRLTESSVPMFTTIPPVLAIPPTRAQDGFALLPNEDGGRDLAVWSEDDEDYIRLRIIGTGANRRISFVEPI